MRGIGRTREEAFAQAALALTGVVADPARVAAVECVPLRAEGPDDELLFMAWIDAIVYEMAVRRMLFARYEVKIDEQRLTALAWGEAVDVSKHEPAVEIKAATFAELKVKQAGDGMWIAQCVVDV